MISKELIEQLSNEHLEGTPNYLVDVKVSRSNKVLVTIDNDHGGIKIDACVALSRFLDDNLDREKEDYELEVSSHGIGQPLLLMRQFKKNEGRLVIITHNDGTKTEGTLISTTDAEITVEAEVKNPATKKKSPPSLLSRLAR